MTHFRRMKMRTPFHAVLALLATVIVSGSAHGESLEQVAARADSLESVLESLRGDMETIQAQLDSLQGAGADSTTTVDAAADSAKAEPAEPDVISLNQEVGIEIDADERERFGLFANIEGFRSATYLKYPDGRYMVVMTRVDDAGNEVVVNNNVSAAGIEYVRAKLKSASE
jgi:hypothetical protein